MGIEREHDIAVLHSSNPFRLGDFPQLPFFKSGQADLARIAERVIGLDAMAKGYAEIGGGQILADGQSATAGQFAEKILDYLNISHELADGQLDTVPASGPVVVVANHPFGGIEGVLLLHLMKQLRPDVKIMANDLLKRIPELADSFIGVNPYGGDGATRANVRSMREAVRWLKGDGLLVVFPAGDVSSLKLRSMRIVEGPWDATIARISRVNDAVIVPVFIEGKNGHAFNVLGKLHPRMRTLMLPREMLNKKGRTMRLWIGSPFSGMRLKRLGNDEEIAGYLRLRCCMLGSHDKREKREAEAYETSLAVTDGQVPIIEAVTPSLLQNEIDRLGEGDKLASSADLDVYCADAAQIPMMLQEIGRLREVTFRAAGEGTGRAIDLDHYDRFYLHLFIWDRKAQKLVGAYRLGLSDKILRRQGMKGFYSRSLFKFHPGFIASLAPAVELGRSFVRLEYQRNVAPLMLLWKGIGAFVARNPQYAVLFGPVSISNDYRSVSQQLMIDFLKANSYSDPLRRFIRPRRPYRGAWRPVWRKSDLRGMGSIDGISELVSILEGDGKGAPVLMRHYLNIGGRMLGFNVDQQFGNCIDGLVVVDLREAGSRVLNRYMGPEGAAQFLDYHNPDLPLAV